MLSTRCLRCGAASREPLCASCLDYLVNYSPLWLDPALLSGPSLLDLVGSRETAILSADLSRIEWRAAPVEARTADALRLIELLGLDRGTPAVLSAGDADVLHAFLGSAKRGAPLDASARAALAILFRFLSTQDWIPPHLATQYGLRAKGLEALAEPPRPSQAAARVESVAEAEAVPVAPPEPLPEFLEAETKLPEVIEPIEVPRPPPPEEVEAEEAPTPEPAPRPQPGIPPEPMPGPPPPVPEPEPEEAEVPTSTEEEDLEEMREALEREREALDAWLQTQSVELAKRALDVEAKEREVEEREQAVTERLVAVERDEARRDVLRFLGTVPGMTEAQADVLAAAFPDTASLVAADVRALTQCQGVTEGLARAIRYALVPGEVEEEDRAIELKEQAAAFMEERNFAGALECYERLLEERPVDVDLWFNKAELLVLLDRPGEALPCYTRVLDLDRGNRQAWLERANVLFGMGRYADAVDSLKEALKIDPSKSADILLRADQLRRDGRANEAAILLQTILDADPGNTRAVIALGDAFLELGDMDAAEALFTRALGENPQIPEILVRKGVLLNRKGRWGAAIQFYNRAIALHWDYPDAWISKGEALLEHGRREEAVECFDKAIAFAPKSAEAWAGRARAHAALGQRDEARSAFDRAAAIDPDHPSVATARASVAALPEEREPYAEPRALPADFKAFTEALEPEKEEVAVLVELAELALEGGDPEMAILRYDEALAQDPRSPDAWAGKGRAYQQMERYPEALEAYEQALKLAPDHAAALQGAEACRRHLEEAS